MEKTKEIEETLYGRRSKFTLPSGHWVEIREQNGNDDDIISNRATAKDLTNFNILISSLILDTNLPMATDGKLPASKVDELLLGDKYAIIFGSRIHSMGPDVRFKIEWNKEDGGPQDYEEDLNNLWWDFSKPYPEQGEEGYSKDRIKPDPINCYGSQTLNLTSGKELRDHFLNGKSEKDLMKLPIEEMTRNAEIKARGLEQKIAEKWVKVTNFMFFTKKDMSEIYRAIRENDPEFLGTTDITNPKTNQTVAYSIIQSEDFFYPQEI
jgi:hypothetical protein